MNDFRAIRQDAMDALALLRQLSPDYRNATQLFRLLDSKDDPRRLWDAITKLEIVVNRLTEAVNRENPAH